MSKKNSLCIVLTAVLLTACGSTPKNAAIEQARSDYQTAQTNPQIAKYAQLELKQAGDALHVAENSLNERQDTNIINHFAYMAKQKIAIANETARLRVAEETIQHADSQRTGVLLDARTAEADLANRKIQQLEQELNAKNSDRGMVITLGDVLFDTDKSQLKPGGMRTLQKLSEFLKANNERKVVIEGFTDSTGSEEYNLNLSERRANTVKNALLDLGISADRIISRGYGKSYPVAGNDTAAGRQLNRRVEVIVSRNADDIAPR
jgi:outer membrane protein OmpA-like peptidoglycan-associated protein